MSRRPNLGFAGLGWIGRARLDAVARAGVARIGAICDPDGTRLGEAGDAHPLARPFADFGALLEAAADLRLDGIVLATPNGLHRDQALGALDGGLAVFVQKPLATDADDVERVLERARDVDRAIEVDYSYRGLDAARTLRRRIAHGDLGEVFLVETAFHNAWGPDKAWCYDRSLSGGGCLLDLGVHLVDLALFVTCGTSISAPRGWTRPLADHPDIDGFAGASFDIDDGPRVRLATSWHAHTGRDCAFHLEVFGSEGSALIRNVGGSFYDFELLVRAGRSEDLALRESRAWMDRTIVEWAERLATDKTWDDRATTNLHVARVVDAVYGETPVASR